MSTRDHPDWWRPVGGCNSQDSTLERRSLVWNDDGIEDGTIPAVFSQAGTYEGKFYTRGCRGMIEELQLYCIGDGIDTITLRYSPHPCLGPVGEVIITPAAAWAWQVLVIREMWNYDSLFIWVHECGGNVDWAYDTELPYDGHMSLDAGATWADANIRPFIRVVYTGETPGDVPVSGIVNNIPIPATSSLLLAENVLIDQNVITDIVLVEGAGYVDLVVCRSVLLEHSHRTAFMFYADGDLCLDWRMDTLDDWGFNDDTQPLALVEYAVDGDCTFMVTKRWEFRRTFLVRAYNALGGSFVYVHVHPNLMR